VSQQVNAVLFVLRPAAGACLIAIQNMGLASRIGGLLVRPYLIAGVQIATNAVLCVASTLQHQ